jgi:outer membrane receptor protein involved in Fe transport
VRSFFYVLVMPAFFASAPPTCAQASSAALVDGKRVFTPDFFASYAPVSALDMVERVPGFSINQGDDRRGFGENAGNVLIDGDRPSTKSDNIRTLLGRIPADQVARLELSEQAGTAADARGQAQTVNVIRKDNASLSGTYSASIEMGERSDVSPFGEGAISLRRGETTYDLNAGYFRQYNRQIGPETVFDRLGRVTEVRRQDNRSSSRIFSSSGGIKTLAGDAKINLKASAAFELNRNRRESDILSPTNVRVAVESLRERLPQLEKEFEASGDIEYPLSVSVTSKLVGLHNWSRFKGDGFIGIDRFANGNAAFTTRTRDNERETIARLQNDWKASASHAVQFGAELALNKLQANFSAASTSNGEVTQFPASNVRVSEWRVEPFVSDVWSLSPAWKLEAGAIYEVSSLKVRGDAQAERRLQFLKPKAVATWTLSQDSSLEFRINRDVTQLDFNDFATSVDLGANAQVEAGNSDLVPENSWQLATTLRQKFWERGSLQFTVSYDFVSDTQDQVPIIVRNTAGAITSRFDGVGNIGSSRRWNVELELTLPLDSLTRSFGLAGMEIKYVTHYHGSRVTDPVTGLSRRVSNRPEHHHDVNFRHDISGLGVSWGFDMNYRAPQRSYFFNQLQRVAAAPEYFAWLEYKKLRAGTLRFQVGNPTDTRLRRDRFFYRDTRATDDIVQTIKRVRSRDTRFLLSLSGTF